MPRTIGFIDGFNLYHALVSENHAGIRPYATFRWLNYWKLTECFLHPGDVLKAVYYFTSYAAWNTPLGKQKKEKHIRLVEAQTHLGVQVVFGRFRPVTKQCRASCKQLYKTYEEKRTDVNIAVTIVELAAKREFDKAILISADSDLLPALEAAKRLNSAISFTVVTPIGHPGKALSNAANFCKRMKIKHLRRSLLPPTLILQNGKQITAPTGWN
jgi:uncharacterized LabA/DUF88 family protein